MISQEAALDQANTVYRRLLAQGRREADARRDAERWVMGNHGVEVTLPAPERDGHVGPVYGPYFEYGSVNFSPFASATSAVSEDISDLFRTMVQDVIRQRTGRRAEIYADITRLEAEREVTARQAREATRDGFDATAAALWIMINDLNRRIKWYREQMRNA